MALFIDFLTAQLFAMTAVFLTLAYGFLKAFRIKSTVQEYRNSLKPLYIPLYVMGVFITVSGLFGMLLWPLPGSYNILFYDLYPVLGLGLIGIAVSFKNEYKLEYLGVLGIIWGFITIWYGISGFMNNMTLEPIMLLLLYLFTGLGSIIFYPISMMLDTGKGIRVIFLIEAVILIIAGVIAAIIAGMAIPQHLVIFSKWSPIL
jgi:putative membrane protein